MKYVIDDLRSLNKFSNIPSKISIDILFLTIIVRIVILADKQHFGNELSAYFKIKNTILSVFASQH